jgi:radical SAM protein with 4Fe4S-binding SPASM domain
MHIDTLKFYKYVPVKKPIYKGKFCQEPFTTLQIDLDGDVQLCGCQLHMPYTIGNIYNNTLQEIWLSHSAEQVRQSVSDGDFTYCNWACSALLNLPLRPSQLPVVNPFPKIIKIDLDRSCNLKCPSCREHVIIEKNSARIDKQIELYTQIKQYALENPNTNIIIMPLTSGEIFASHSGLEFLKSLIDYPFDNLKIEITTNGTLINKNKKLIKNIGHLIKSFSVSIDAATPETYSQVRGGDWSELLLGLNFIKELGTYSLKFNYCIQKNNFHEIEQFAQFANSFGANVYYQKLLDWGHWTIAWWHDNNVFDRTRPSFESALEMLKRVKQTYPKKIYMMAELTKYLEKQKNAVDFTE